MFTYPLSQSSVFTHFNSNAFMNRILLLIAFVIHISSVTIAQPTYPLQVDIQVAETLTSSLQPDGRLYLFISPTNQPAPRQQTWPRYDNHIFAQQLTGSFPTEGVRFDADQQLAASSELRLADFPAGTYHVQALYDQHTEVSAINAAGNLYSEVQTLSLKAPAKLAITLTQSIEESTPTDTRFIKFIRMQSDTLSQWWDKPMYVNFSALQPRD